MPNFNLARKITLKNIGLTKDEVKKAVDGVKESETVQIARVIGVATSYTTGQTDKGAFVKLAGDFRARNILTGAEYRSGACILPSFISDAFVGVLQQHGKAEFALAIGATRRDDAITGYEYTAMPLIESTSSDAMQKLENAAFADLPAPVAAPALEAPKPRAAKAAKKAASK